MISGKSLDFEKLGPLAMYARVDFLETYYVMGWFPVNTVHTFRITTFANLDLGSTSGQDRTVITWSQIYRARTKVDSVKALRRVSNREQGAAADFVNDKA